MPSSEEVTGTEAATATMGRQENSTNPPVITDLPTEILLKIFEEFCLHYQPGGNTLVNSKTMSRATGYRLSTHQNPPKGRIVKKWIDKPWQEYRTPPISIRTLKSLTKTCQRFCAIAQPILYHAIHLDHMQPKSSGVLHTPLNKVHLASAVKSICVDDPGKYADDDDGDNDAEDVEDAETATTHLNEIELVSILAVAPRVENIFLILHPDRLRALNNDITTVERHLGDRNIKSLTILSTILYETDGWDPRLQYYHRGLGSVSLDDSVPLLKLAASTLRSLTVSASMQVSESFALSLGRQTLQDPAPLQSISELVLWESSLDCEFGHQRRNGLSLDQIRNLLRAIGPNLASLVISNPRTRDSQWASQGSYYEVMLQELLVQLLPWKNTLRKLVFGSMNDLNTPPVDIRSSGVGVLGEFVALETLAIRDDDYFRGGGWGTSHLPPVDGPTFVSALSPRHKTLFLMGMLDISSVLDSVLHSYHAGNLPELANVGIRFISWRHSTRDRFARLERIRRDFLKEGVTLSVGPSMPGNGVGS